MILWQCVQEGLSQQSQAACRLLKSNGVPIAYVLLAKSEEGARAVALSRSSTGACCALQVLEDSCALLWRDARTGDHEYLWRPPAKTMEMVDATVLNMQRRSKRAPSENGWNMDY